MPAKKYKPRLLPTATEIYLKRAVTMVGPSGRKFKVSEKEADVLENLGWDRA